jgi:hypothetical protein
LQASSTTKARCQPAMSAAYDRAAELRALDATFSGIHGLVDSSITHIPHIFCVEEPPPEPIVHAAGQETVASSGSDHRPGDRPQRWPPCCGCGHMHRRGAVVVLPCDVPWRASSVDGRGGGCVEGSDKEPYMHEPARAVNYHCNFDMYQSRVLSLSVRHHRIFS